VPPDGAGLSVRLNVKVLLFDPGAVSGAPAADMSSEVGRMPKVDLRPFDELGLALVEFSSDDVVAPGAIEKTGGLPTPEVPWVEVEDGFEVLSMGIRRLLEGLDKAPELGTDPSPALRGSPEISSAPRFSPLTFCASRHFPSSHRRRKASATSPLALVSLSINVYSPSPVCIRLSRVDFGYQG
jgi:hypothetical protein